MPHGQLRKLLIIPEPESHGICRDCGQKFTPDKAQSTGWRTQVTQQFEAHRKAATCKKVDERQNAARIVREATEDK